MIWILSFGLGVVFALIGYLACLRNNKLTEVKAQIVLLTWMIGALLGLVFFMFIQFNNLNKEFLDNLEEAHESTKTEASSQP